MLPQTHKIIADIIFEDVYHDHGIRLNKKRLVYGSIKPDIYSGIPKLKHFKPQSFAVICQDISNLSANYTEDNPLAIAKLSQTLGVITHYVSDYFCVPHNDRATYHKHIISHVQYENKLHRMYKESDLPTKACATRQWLDFTRVEKVMNYLDELHGAYSFRSESLLNDLNSSLQASRAVATMIVQQAIQTNTTTIIAA